jgi:hypothetical protein
MKIMAPCVLCAKESMEKAKRGESYQLPILDGELDDTGLIYARCPWGHDSVVTTMHPKHEILFNSGCKALIDGYASESVASVASALERAYEFFLRVAFRKSGLNNEPFEVVWKMVSSQSERQYGAFLFIFLHLTGNAFTEPKIVREFRNKVIHKGIIVKQSETREYVNAVFFLLRSTIKALKERCAKEYSDEINDLHEKQMALVNGRSCIAYRGLSVDSFTKDSLSDYLAELYK